MSQPPSRRLRKAFALLIPGAVIVMIVSSVVSSGARGSVSGILLGVSLTAPLVAFGSLTLWIGRDRVSLSLGLFTMSLGAAVFPFDQSRFALQGPFAFAYELTTFFSAFALYAVADALASRSGNRGRRVFIAVQVARAVAILMLPISVVMLFAPRLSPLGYAETKVTVVAILWVLALILLAVVGRSAGVRSRIDVLFWATLAGASGVIISTVAWGARMPHVDGLWLTLLAIPVGWSYVVLWDRLIALEVIVIGSVISAINGTIVVLDLQIEDIAKHSILNPANQHVKGLEALPTLIGLGAAFVVGRFHHLVWQRVPPMVRRIFYHERDRAASWVSEFVETSATRSGPDVESAVLGTAELFRARGAALYERSEEGYSLRCSRGAQWPEMIAFDVSLAMLRERRALDLSTIAQLGQIFGGDGAASGINAGNGVIGILAIGARIDGEPYDDKELELFRRLADRVADAWIAESTAQIVRYLKVVARDGLTTSFRQQEASRILRSPLLESFNDIEDDH